MFRRVSSVPRVMRAVSTRMCSNKSLYDNPAPAPAAAAAPGTKAATVLNKFLNVMLVVMVTSNVVYCWYFNKVFHAREYITDEDMHEYRSQPRNVYENKTDDEARAELLKVSIEADKKAFEIQKERKPTLSAETVAAYEKDASDKWWTFIKNNISFSTADRNRNLDSYLRFYYTYTERAEQLRRVAWEEAKEAAEREKNSGN